MRHLLMIYSNFKRKIKITIEILILLISFVINSQEAFLFPTQNTIRIDKSDTKDSIILKAAHVVPTSNQLEALKDNYIAFIHFGPNTFTKKEWGTGLEDPRVFNLQNLDTDQWCRSIKDAGMTKVIFTAKHHDGFVLWQSRYTKHGVMSSPFKNGKGDILRELSNSCRKYGLKLGIYLSPADLYQIENPIGLYGNLSKSTERRIPRKVKGRAFDNKTVFKFEVDDYNEYFLNQLFELLTEYGPIHEVWFDGAHPKRKGGQKYNYKAWKELIKELAAEAAIFGKEDLRWVGNESGETRTSEWNVIPYKGDPDKMEIFGDLTDSLLGTREQLYQGNYLHYQPAEVNTSIREGWFYRDKIHQRVRTVEDVFDIYERAVGGNSIFLLNIPPNREGLFSDEDVLVLKNSGKRIRETYSKNLFSKGDGPAEVLDDNLNTYILIKEDPLSLELHPKNSITINRLLIQEAVATHGERVEMHVLEAWVNGAWKKVAEGTNIGFKKILRFPEVSSNRFRLSFPKVRYIPAIATISGHFAPPWPPLLEIERDLQGLVTINPKKDEFSWKVNDNKISESFENLEIKYAVEGDTTFRVYTEPFFLKNGKVTVVSVQDGQMGSKIFKDFGLFKKEWKTMGVNKYIKGHPLTNAIDANPESVWISTDKSESHLISIDLGREYSVTSFIYTPSSEKEMGMLSQGIIEVSSNKKRWIQVEEFQFGNLINDPTTRIHYFEKPVLTRYIRVKAKKTGGTSKSVSAAEIGFNIDH